MPVNQFNQKEKTGGKSYVSPVSFVSKGHSKKLNNEMNENCEATHIFIMQLLHDLFGHRDLLHVVSLNTMN